MNKEFRSALDALYDKARRLCQQAGITRLYFDEEGLRPSDFGFARVSKDDIQLYWSAEMESETSWHCLDEAEAEDVLDAIEEYIRRVTCGINTHSLRFQADAEDTDETERSPLHEVNLDCYEENTPWYTFQEDMD